MRITRARAGAGWRRVRVAPMAALAAAFAAAAFSGCSSKQGVVEPPPVIPGEVRVEGNRIVWTTDRDARASVRYGYVRGSWDHDAYPDAAGRVDRTPRRDHSVALLDLRTGAMLYFQAVSEAAGQAPAYSPVDSFVAGASSGALLVSTMIHIGFGDSHLITMPTTGKRFLIDSGGRNAAQSVITYLQAHNVTAIDAMLATHVHEDHLGGIVGSSAPGDGGVLGAFPPAVFFDSPVKSGDSTGKPAYIELLASLTGATQRIAIARGQSAVDTPALRLDPEVNILVLNSGTPQGYVPVGHEGTDINNESIVLRFSYGDVDFVIGGDCERESEASILGAFPASALDAEYLKCQHHGLQDASSPAYVNALRPRVAFIPNTQAVWEPPQSFEGAIANTVATVQGAGAHVYVIDDARTLDKPRSSGRQYNVSFVTDGRSYEVRVEPATQPTPSFMAQESECWQKARAGHEHAAGDGGTP